MITNTTEALGSTSVYLTKSLVFQLYGALPFEAILKGLIIGVAMMAGSWAAKRIVERLDTSQFHATMDALMLVAGLAMLWGALTP